MPLVVVLMAIFFNAANSYINGAFLFHLMPNHAENWHTSLPFLMGSALFASGMFINIQSDNILLKLGKTKEGNYQIPRGGLYQWLSCPNYFGEIMEWCGWALATWSLGGFSFAAWTMANLIPRAISHHRWYRQQFPDYPKTRKAILPFLI